MRTLILACFALTLLALCGCQLAAYAPPNVSEAKPDKEFTVDDDGTHEVKKCPNPSCDCTKPCECRGCASLERCFDPKAPPATPISHTTEASDCPGGVCSRPLEGAPVREAVGNVGRRVVAPARAVRRVFGRR